MRLIHLNNSSYLLWNGLLLIESYILAQQADLSVNRLSRLEHSTFTQSRSPVATGSTHFLSTTPTLSYPQHVGLTQNGPRHLTVLLLTAILMSLLVLLSCWVFGLKIMDEKGCQRGGGKRSSHRKYFYSRRQHTKYKHQSANLELITIIESICADGTELIPGFVFPGSSFCPEWFENHPDIVYLIFLFLCRLTN